MIKIIIIFTSKGSVRPARAEEHPAGPGAEEHRPAEEPRPEVRAIAERLPSDRRHSQSGAQPRELQTGTASGQVLGEEAMHLLERDGLPGRCVLGDAGRSNLPAVSERARLRGAAEVLLRVQSVELAEAGAAAQQPGGLREPRLSGVGLSNERARPVPPDADHHAVLSAAEQHVQRDDLHAQHHDERIQAGPADLRAGAGRQTGVEGSVRAIELLWQVPPFHRGGLLKSS